MATILFDKIVFGPVKSRRLGASLGINLLPVEAKVCSFNCVYCECGFQKRIKGEMPQREEVKNALYQRLDEIKKGGMELDAITFAGNGEPTLHPDFSGIIDDTIALRDLFCPQVKVSVLSNATRLHNPAVVEALNKVDNNILKLDSAIETTLRKVNQPRDTNMTVAKIVASLKQFNGNFTLQTMFLRGTVDGEWIDNTSEEELNAWFTITKEINPKQIMIYSIARETPCNTLQKVKQEELSAIAEGLKKGGFNVLVY